jgi:hypothetical protein
VARTTKPFEQYATLLPDGRFAVQVTVFDPFLVRVVIAAPGKRQALERVRALGGRDVHVSKSFRPGGTTVRPLVDEGLEGVFAPEPFGGTWLPLAGLPAFLDGTSRDLARYDTSAFDRGWVRPTALPES